MEIEIVKKKEYPVELLGRNDRTRATNTYFFYPF